MSVRPVQLARRHERFEVPLMRRELLVGRDLRLTQALVRVCVFG